MLQLEQVYDIKVIEYTVTGTKEVLAQYLDTHPNEVGRRDSKIGNCPLHIACYRGNQGKVEVLLKNHADINQADIFGNAALHYAINQGNKEIVQLLLKNGADVNHANHRGTTPLHASAAINNVSLTRMLVKYSAIPDLYDLDHKKPADLARNAIIVELLEKAVEARRLGLSAPPNENLNWMGFGVGLGIGMGLAIVKQRMDYLEQCRLDEIKRKEEEAVAKRLAEAAEKAARGKQFRRRLLEHK